MNYSLSLHRFRTGRHAAVPIASAPLNVVNVYIVVVEHIEGLSNHEYFW